MLQSQTKENALLVGAVDPAIIEEKERKIKEQKLLKKRDDAGNYEAERLGLCQLWKKGKLICKKNISLFLPS